MKTGRKSAFSNEDLACAYELNVDGVSWKLIEREFGKGIKDAVHYALKRGVH